MSKEASIVLLNGTRILAPCSRKCSLIEPLLYSQCYAETSSGAHLRGLTPRQHSSKETWQRRRAVTTRCLISPTRHRLESQQTVEPYKMQVQL